MSAFTELISLDVSNCDLTSLDVSPNQKLRYLNASKNHLPRFDVSKNENLKVLDASEQTLSKTLSVVQIGNVFIVLLDSCVSDSVKVNIKSVAGYSGGKQIISSDYYEGLLAAVIISSDKPDALVYFYDVGFGDPHSYSMDVKLTNFNVKTGTLKFASIDIAVKTISACDDYSSGYTFEFSPVILSNSKYVTVSIGRIEPADAGLKSKDSKIVGNPLLKGTYTVNFNAAIAGTPKSAAT